MGFFLTFCIFLLWAKEASVWKGLMMATNVQCRHLIPALIAWAFRAKYTTACLKAPPVSWVWIHG